MFQVRIEDFTRAGVQSIEKGHRRSSAKGAEVGGVWEGGCAPSQKIFVFLISKSWVFMHSRWYVLTLLFSKKHPNQKGGCPDTLDWPAPVFRAGPATDKLLFHTQRRKRSNWPAVMRNAQKAVEDVTEWRHALQIVQHDHGRRRTAGSDVIGDVIGAALVGEVVEILAQLATGLTVHLVDRDQFRRRTALNVVRPATDPTRSVTCRMESHPTQVNAPPTVTPAMQAGTRFTYPGGMEGWVDLGVGYITSLHVGWLICGTLCLIRSVSVLWLISVSHSKTLIYLHICGVINHVSFLVCLSVTVCVLMLGNC